METDPIPSIDGADIIPLAQYKRQRETQERVAILQQEREHLEHEVRLKLARIRVIDEELNGNQGA